MLFVKMHILTNWLRKFPQNYYFIRINLNDATILNNYTSIKYV